MLVLGLWALARNPGHHARFSLLLMLAAGMGMFAASYAATLQRSFVDRALYESGADVRLALLRPLQTGKTVALAEQASALAGVRDASLVLRESGAVVSTGLAGDYQLLAVDAETLPEVAWSRGGS